MFWYIATNAPHINLGFPRGSKPFPARIACSKAMATPRGTFKFASQRDKVSLAGIVRCHVKLRNVKGLESQVPAFRHTLNKGVLRKGKTMKTLRPLALMAIAAGILLAPADEAHAQVAVSIGVAPVCPYGYYEAPPYNCAPDGYYGPEWFGGGGIFIGAGPWYHGSDHFYGHVDHQLDYRKGYHGAMPARGAAPAEHRAEFHGQAMHDVHGHEAPRGRK